METPEHDIEITQGATFSIGFVYREEGGTRINLAGCKVRMQVRDRFDGKVLADLSSDPLRGIVMSETEIGRFDIEISRLTTRRMPILEAVYDIFIDYPGAVSECFIRGEANINGAATR